MIGLIFLAAIAAISLPNRTPIHPLATSLFTGEDIENLECRESQGASSMLDAGKPSRTANFGVLGSYNCYRPIFRTDERNSYIERAIEAETLRAKRVSLSIANQMRDVNPIAVEVDGVEDPLRGRIAAIYRVELSLALGPGRVRRSFADSSSPILQIQMRNVDLPELMSSARLKFSNAKGGFTWRDI